MKKRGLLLTVLCIAVMMTGGCGVGNEAEDNTKITDNSGVDKSTEQETDEETTKCTETLESLNINPHDIMEYIGEAPEGAEYPERYITDYEVIQAEPFILKVRDCDSYCGKMNGYSFFSKDGLLLKHDDIWYEVIIDMDNYEKSFFYKPNTYNNRNTEEEAMQITGESSDGSYAYMGSVNITTKDSVEAMNHLFNSYVKEDGVGERKDYEITKDGRVYYISFLCSPTDIEESVGMDIKMYAYTDIDGEFLLAGFEYKATDEPIFKNPETFLTEEFVNNLIKVNIYK